MVEAIKHLQSSRGGGERKVVDLMQDAMMVRIKPEVTFSFITQVMKENVKASYNWPQ